MAGRRYLAASDVASGITIKPHKSIWATRSALVFALRLLRLCRAAIGPYWRLPATEYQSGHAFGAQRGARLPDSGRVAGARQRIQRFRGTGGVQPVQGPVSAQLARKSQGWAPASVQFVQP